jgi:hypothetical protein
VISGRGSGKGALRSHAGLRSGAAKCGGLDAASREQDRLTTPPLADERICGRKAAVFSGHEGGVLQAGGGSPGRSTETGSCNAWHDGSCADQLGGGAGAGRIDVGLKRGEPPSWT